MELESTSLRLNISNDSWLFNPNGFAIPEVLSNEFSNNPLSPATFETIDFDSLLVENENSDDSTSSPTTHFESNLVEMQDIKPTVKKLKMKLNPIRPHKKRSEEGREK